MNGNRLIAVHPFAPSRPKESRAFPADLPATFSVQAGGLYLRPDIFAGNRSLIDFEKVNLIKSVSK